MRGTSRRSPGDAANPRRASSPVSGDPQRTQKRVAGTVAWHVVQTVAGAARPATDTIFYSLTSIFDTS
jgi:hypothetical protein